MSKIQDLKETIKKALADITEINIFGHINRETLKSRLKRVENIEKILERDKYNIVFVGTIGAGKTTAISHLFNLTQNAKKTIERRGKTRKINIVEPLLSTGSGRTTICEVEINFSDKVSIEINPFSQNELKREIENFCDFLYGNKKEGGKEYGSSISEELERAIRSIIGLKKNVSTSDDSKKKIDEAKEKSKEFTLSEFKEYVLEKANLEQRVYTREESSLHCTEENAHQWIKDNFSKINKAEISTFSIPKKIYIYINEDIYGDSFLESFSSIIDTKGIDENPIREDLMEYIDDDNTIVVFTSSYNDAPQSDIRELIEHSLSKKSKKYQDRFILLAMPRNNEPANENDGDGSWENGISLKKDIIKKVFKEKNLNFIDNHILFYDALRFFYSDGRIDTEYEEDIQYEKNDLLYDIHNIIRDREKKLNYEIEEIRKSCYNITEGNIELTKEEKNKIENLSKKLVDIRDLSRRIPNWVYEEFIESYINYYKIRYKAWNTKDAIHRRYGVFSERGYSTYFDAKIVAKGITQDEMLYKFTKELRKEIIEEIDNLGSSVEKLKELTPEIIKLFEVEYDAFIDSVGNNIQIFLENENRNKEFWAELIDRRGKGRGYNDDVARILKNKLKTLKNGLSIDGIFQYYTEDEWEKLIDKILIFFKK